MPVNGYKKKFCIALCEIETGEVNWASEPETYWASFLPGEKRVLAHGLNNTWHTLDAESGKLLRSVQLDLGTIPNEDGWSRKAVFYAQDISADGMMLVGAVGLNCFFESESSLGVQVWMLGRTPRLVNAWRDLTQPDLR
jgi:hypothetical protein